MLSHRTKQANRDLVSPALAATTAFLDRLEAEASAFVPTVPPLTAPAARRREAAGQQQQQEQKSGGGGEGESKGQ